MAVGILLITHKGIGTALVAVATRLLDVLPLRVEALEVPFDGDPDVLLPQASAALRKVDGGDGVLLLTDLYGATPSNLAAQPEVQEFASQISALLDTWLPRMQSGSTRSYITVAFGCTGGRHRSVYLAEHMAARARQSGWDEVAVHHRELD